MSADFYFNPRRFESTESESKETTADVMFTYEQLETICTSLRREEVPKRVNILHYTETFLWCDEWEDACEVTILMELASGKEIQLFKANEPRDHESNNYHGYSLERRVKERTKKKIKPMNKKMKTGCKQKDEDSSKKICGDMNPFRI